MKRKLIDLANQRSQFLNEAEAAVRNGDSAAYDAAMEKVANINTEIGRVQDLMHEQERVLDMQVPTRSEYTDMAEERGHLLMSGNEIKFSSQEIRRALNSVLAAGALAAPTGVQQDINDIPGGGISSLIDQVTVEDLTGMTSFDIPYLISEQQAAAGDIHTNAGTARASSSDPSFGVASIKPYEVTTTNFVDRNISKLSPVRYYEKVRALSLTALRRKVNHLIANGDSESTHIMFGMINALNKNGDAIYASKSISALGVDTLDDLFFAYGGDEEVGPNARLILQKANLQAIGKIRGTNEKKRVFDVSYDANNANTGTIKDGGLIIPYTICSPVEATKLLYGDPKNYTLGLFGDYTIRVDESVKSVERMIAILGDVAVGGNLTAHHGMVVGTIGSAG